MEARRLLHEAQAPPHTQRFAYLLLDSHTDGPFLVLGQQRCECLKGQKDS